MLSAPVCSSKRRVSRSTAVACLRPAPPACAYTKMFVSTNSTLMQFVARPLDFAFHPSIGRVPYPFQEAPLGLLSLRLLFDHFADGQGNEAAHRLVASGREDPKASQQFVRQAQRDVGMFPHVI